MVKLAWERGENITRIEDEYRDILDENRNPTGRVHKRGESFQKGDYFLCNCCWIMNSAGEFLITRRALGVKWAPGMWGVAGGGVLSGEDSLTAAIREAKEEVGVDLLPHNALLFAHGQIDNAFVDHWLFRQEFDLSQVNLQTDEVIDARAATWDEISAMIERGEFIGNSCETIKGFLNAANCPATGDISAQAQ